MNDNVENLILTQLREIREEIGAMRQDVSAIRGDVTDVDQKVDGLAVMLTMLAGHVHHIEERVTSLEEGESA
jgi:peptidoglycan hydrolase CwlO-like protein